MAFPPRFGRVLDAFGVTSDTKAALLDMYLQIGPGVLDAFPDLADRFDDPADIRPEHLAAIRPLAVRAYLDECHPLWLEGHATRSFYTPRFLGGRASGLVTPLGPVEEDSPGLPGEVARATRAIVGTDQPVPKGVLLAGQGAHYGGLEGTLSFDIASASAEDALAVALAAGRQHTVPGSLGQTSATLDDTQAVALVWEVQPNAFKPDGELNRAITKVFRRNRNWHVATACAALFWLSDRGAAVFAVRGAALKATHEVNPDEPVTPAIEEMHDRTIARVVSGLSGQLRPPDASESRRLLSGNVMLPGLRRLAESDGVSAAVQRIELPAR